MAIHPARRLWQTLETLHDVAYFAPEVRDVGIATGLKGYWMTYFAFRAAPLGPVGAPAVIASFANFNPEMVSRAIPDAWSRATPEQCLAARATVTTAALRGIGVDPAAAGRAVELLAPALKRLDVTGRPLAAANAALPVPTDPVGALWQTTATLREHRGDGHTAALVAAGVSGLESHLLQAAAGRFSGKLMRTVRGWSEEDWSKTDARLRDRGLLAGSDKATLTDSGWAALDEVEAHTDRAAWSGGLAILGEDGVADVVDVLAPAVDAMWASGIIPDINPTGLPPHKS